jgi:hypothetical protein
MNLNSTVNICDVLSCTKSSWVSSILDGYITEGALCELGRTYRNSGP